jgi:hypothetical protein
MPENEKIVTLFANFYLVSKILTIQRIYAINTLAKMNNVHVN